MVRAGVAGEEITSSELEGGEFWVEIGGGDSEVGGGAGCDYDIGVRVGRTHSRGS